MTCSLREPDGAEVRYYRIEKHDHVWPGGDAGVKQMKDKLNLDASKLIWTFFSELSLENWWRLVFVSRLSQEEFQRNVQPFAPGAR